MPERTEKTISFRAEDRGVSSTIDRLREKVDRMRDSILENALKFSEASRDTVQQIEEQTRAVERRQRLETTVGVERVRERFREQITGKRTEFERFERGMGRAVGVEGVELERGKMEEAVKGMETAMREEIAEEKRGTELTLQILRELIETFKETSKQELREDRKGVEQTVKAYQRGELEDVTAEVKTKAKVQQDELEREADQNKRDRRGAGFMQIFAGSALGTFTANMLQNIGKVGGALAGAEHEERVIAEGLRGLPFIGGFSGTAYARHIESREAAERGTLRLAAITGRGGERMFSATQLGFDITEIMPIAQQVAQRRGFRGNIQGDTRDILGIEKAFGVDRGLLMDISQREAFDKGGGAFNAVTRLMAEMGLRPGESDLSNLQNLIETSNNLLREQSGSLESIDSNATARVVAAFQNIGGSFADPRAKERVMNIHRSLTSPANEFQQALSFATLAQLDPGASYYQIREMQETGITQKGFLGTLLKNYESMYGSGELAMEAVRQRFGLSFAQGRTLWEGYQADRTVWDAIAGEDELKDQLARQDVQILGAKRTSDLEKSTAEITNAFVEGMSPGMLKVAEKTGIKMGNAIKETLDIDVFGVDFGKKIAVGILIQLIAKANTPLK